MSAKTPENPPHCHVPLTADRKHISQLRRVNKDCDDTEGLVRVIEMKE
jgi:hypothetical protein